MTYKPNHPILQKAKADICQKHTGEMARVKYLAYAYLRGRAYRNVEPHCRPGTGPMDTKDLASGSWQGKAVRNGVAVQVLNWLGVPLTRGPEVDAVIERLRGWVAQPHTGKAARRCPDLPERDGLLEQVREWVPAVAAME